MQGKILVIGSSNTDMVVKTRQFPRPGETVLGGTFLMTPGGKGANQAVAAARLGARVRFVTKVGDDIFGRQVLEGYSAENLDMQYIATSHKFPSGVALITVNDDGENEIVVASGANMDLTPEDLPDVIFKDVELVLIQLEIPIDTVGYIVQKCSALNIKLVLNPAPATTLPEALLKQIYLITPNETETEFLTGIYPKDDSLLEKAARQLLEKGVEHVVITLGKRGVFLFDKSHSQIIPAKAVDAVDTTAAGDVFSGALVTALANGLDWIPACQFACEAAAYAVTKIGAQTSAPYLRELTIE